jgi:hypothetical protein
LEALYIVIADLMAKAPGAAVDLNRDLALPQAEGIRHLGVIDLINDVYFKKVVPGAQRAYLGTTTFLGSGAELAGVGSFEAALLFGVSHILPPGKATFQSPPGALGHQFGQFPL